MKLLHTSIAFLLVINGLFGTANTTGTVSDALARDPLDFVLQIEELIKSGQLSEARLLLSIKDPESQSFHLNGHQTNYIKGLIHFYEGTYQRAIPLLRAAIHSPAIDRSQELWNLRPLRIINFSFYYQSQLDSSLFYSGKYLQILEKFDAHAPEEWRELRKTAVQSIGHLLIERGNHTEALQQYKLWSEIATDTIEKSLAITYYGRTLIELGATYQGLNLLKAAQSLVEETGTPYPIQFALQAEAYLKINALDKADSSIQRLFNLLSDQPTDTWIAATAEFTKGCILYKRQQYESAIPFFQRSIKTLEQQNPGSQMIILAYTRWYNSLIETNQFVAAENLKQGISSNLLVKNSTHRLHFDLITAKRLRQVGNHEEARTILLEIIKSNTIKYDQGINGLVDPWLQVQTLMNLIAVNQATESIATDSTFQYFLQADKAVDKLRMTYLEYADQISLSDTLHNLYQEAIDYGFRLYTESPHPDLKTDITWMMERSKSMSLYLHLDLKEHHSKSDEHHINHELKYYYSQLFKETEQKTLLKDTLHKLEKAKSGFKNKFGLSRNKTDLTKLSLKLDRDEMLISYYFGKKYLYRLFVNQQSQTIQLIGQVSDAQKAIQKFNNQLLRRDFSREGVIAYRQAANDLFLLLFDNIPKDQLKEHLTIIPDGPLFQVPFELLTTEASGGNFKSLPYLLKGHVINYSQSLSLLDHFKDLKQASSSDVMAIAPNQFESAQPSLAESSSDSRDFGPLTHNQQEAEFVAELFGGIALKKEAATESAFKSKLEYNAIIHLATHAYSDHSDPDNSFIYFQKNERDSLNDGKLYAWEVSQLDIASPLVVLSACNTGLGKTYLGEGPQSLASSFFRAGARSVLMSLWKANDLTTSKLMKQFYANLKTGQTKDVALREAKLAFLEKCDELYAHPAFWGGFVVVGDKRSIDQDRNYNWWLLLIIPTLVALWLLRKKRTYE